MKISNVAILQSCILTSITFQLFDRRAKYLNQSERRLWKSLSAVYMSDEETDDDEGGFIIHKPDWRSTIVVKLIDKLDQRYEKTRQSKEHSRPREQRRIGTPSIRPPPRNAPSWATNLSSEESSPSQQSNPTTPASIISNASTPPCGSSSQTTPFRTAASDIAPRSLSYDEEPPLPDDAEDSSDQELAIMIRAATGCYFS